MIAREITPKLQALSFALLCVCFCLFAVTKTQAAPPTTRVVKFPTKIQIGRIYQAISYSTPGRFLGPASGNVTLPADGKIFLVLDQNTAQSPSILSELAPDAIFVMRVKFGDAKDDFLKEVSRLTALSALDVVEGEFTNAGVARLANLKNLEKLGLINCMLDGSCFSPLKNLPKLGHLDFSDNVLTTAGVEAISNLPYISDLILARTALTDKQLQLFSKLKHLENLDLSGNHGVSINGLIALKECKNLSTLRLRKTTVRPHDLLQLKGLSLTNVELGVYKIDKDELAELKKEFPRCTFLLLNEPNREEKMMFAPLKP